MFFDFPYINQLIFIIGEIAIILYLGMFLLSLIVVFIAFYSIEKKHFYFPRLTKSGLVLTEGMVKAICKLFSLDDQELIAFSIRLQNHMNSRDFGKIPVTQRAIFLPQCLRNCECPANLTPEGLVCKRCGKCEVGTHIGMFEDLGYMVWICPGSTLIKRMVKKYKPKAIIGVGCHMEVKEGLEMADKLGLIAMGVITLKDGCVETLVNWNSVMEIASIGLEKEDGADEINSQVL